MRSVISGWINITENFIFIMIVSTEKELWHRWRKNRKQLRSLVLDELSIKWSEALANHLPQSYSLPGIKKQQGFYDDNVLPHIRRNERVFVIISDGLRYEIGEELRGLLQGELRGAATLSYMQGVVPSTTKMGMTSLLPGANIEITGRGDLVKDGINTEGTPNRQKILEKHNKQAVAIRYEDMVEMKRADYKEAFEEN